MDFNEIKNKNQEELREILAAQRLELRNLKARAKNQQLKQFHKIKETRKLVARINTLLTKLNGEKSVK